VRDKRPGWGDGSQGFRRAPGAPASWNMTAAACPQKVSNFEAVLLAIAGHDLRQPLQVIQSAHERLGHGVRTTSELRCLRTGQVAIDRLKEQLEQLLTAMQVQEATRAFKLAPVRIQQVLRQACRENEHTALSKGLSIHTVFSDGLLLGAALRNLVSNAVKYTQPGGRILLGCRRFGSEIRIDVYDTGIGIPGEQIPRIFEAFTRLTRTGTVSASASSSCGRRSECWVIASTSSPRPAAGLAFPFSPGDPKREQTSPDAAREQKRRAIGRKARRAFPRPWLRTRL
jgi:two-component system, OmpR family, phosphate regulon sensor histidine kinase PhoR